MACSGGCSMVDLRCEPKWHRCASLHEARMPTGSDHNVFLSTVPATGRDRRIALAVVGISALLFVCAAPFATKPLAAVPAFIASYQSALVVNDLITAVLLLSQFAALRTRSLLMLAAGYLFTASIAAAHALTFPGLFAPSGWLNAGPQTTAWLYMIWHGAFPLFVIGYALSKNGKGGDKTNASMPAAILTSIAAALVATAACVFVVTAWHDRLPSLLSQGGFTTAQTIAISTVWCMSLAALAVLWLRRPHSVIDVWLMVVMCAWLFDIALSGIFNASRFDLGFYLGRIYGLCAASFVLAILLIDNVALQEKLSHLLGTARREAASERARNFDHERLFSAVVES